MDLGYNDDYTYYDCMDNPDLVATIIRTFSVSDEWGNTSTCQQNITWERGKADQVTWPEHFSIDCNDTDLDELIASGYSPDHTGWPYIFDPVNGQLNLDNNGFCEISLSYEDEQLSICESEWQIVRTWTFYDICANPMNPVATEYKQSIKVLNPAPVVTVDCNEYTPEGYCVLNATESGLVDHDNCFAIYVPFADVDAGCDNLTELVVETPIGNTTNGGVLPYPGLPIGGPYTITYRAEDECGNATQYDIEVMVLDRTTPTVICDEITEVNLGTQGDTEVDAEVFDDGSSDHISDWAVTFPEDLEIECGNVVPQLGEPEIYFETCELVAVSYNDEVFTDVDDACYKIERQWTVINWCAVGDEIDEEVVEMSERDLWLAGVTTDNPTKDNYRDINLDGSFSTSPTSRSARTFRDSWNTDPATINLPLAGICTQINDPDTDNDSDPWDGYITYNQVVKVNDTVDPEFADGCDIPDVCIDDNTCSASVLLPTPDINECSSFVTFEVTGDLGNGFGPFADVAPGEYDVRYVAMDNCNN